MKNKPFISRLGFALEGLRAAFRTERSFRTQAAVAAALLALLALLQPPPLWWALAGVMVALVLAAELINTALEGLADHLHPERHPQIKLVKDCAAGAVLVLSVGALWVGLWMLWSLWSGGA
ncbi:MAG TPA: diacylglycerol kinase [Gammaproteobacteria bacterium]|nr:diacylglycerol kinase [Gammaproteobacteria bacterium]